MQRCRNAENKCSCVAYTSTYFYNIFHTNYCILYIFNIFLNKLKKNTLKKIKMYIFLPSLLAVPCSLRIAPLPGRRPRHAATCPTGCTNLCPTPTPYRAKLLKRLWAIVTRLLTQINCYNPRLHALQLLKGQGYGPEDKLNIEHRNITLLRF